ncbi:hypothetical protein [Paenibacillus sp. GCM10027626]|uniref:hypothetical protein n=1 Tax=Paenibacillus sp. GCM10027626 TaxID=3273411 RepID=UPI00363496A0
MIKKKALISWIAGSVVILGVAATIILTNQNGKPEDKKTEMITETVDDLSDDTNVYQEGDEFAFTHWHGDDSVYTEINQTEDNQTFVRYTKMGSMDKMSGIAADVTGKLSQFQYVSFTIKADESMAGKTLVARLGDSTLSALLLGNDKTILLEPGTHTYTYAVSSANKWMLDSLDKVHLIAEPGLRSATNFGTFTITRSWFSVEAPDDTSLVEGATWIVWAGNYKIQQVKDVTRVSYSGIKPSSWASIATPVEHDPATQNAVRITLKNTGDSTSYIRLNPVYNSNGENANLVERASEILEPGEEVTVTITELTEQITYFSLLICSSWDVPEGTYSGTVEISNLEFIQLEPSDWQGSSIYEVIQANGIATVTYRNVEANTWQNIFTENVDHQYPEQNAMKMVVQNMGETASYVRVVPMSGEQNLMEPDSRIVESGETKEILVGPLPEKVDKVVLYIDSGADVPAGNHSGILQIQQPVFLKTELEQLQSGT